MAHVANALTFSIGIGTVMLRLNSSQNFLSKFHAEQCLFQVLSDTACNSKFSKLLHSETVSFGIRLLVIVPISCISLLQCPNLGLLSLPRCESDALGSYSGFFLGIE